MEGLRKHDGVEECSTLFKVAVVMYPFILYVLQVLLKGKIVLKALLPTVPTQ